MNKLSVSEIEDLLSKGFIVNGPVMTLEELNETNLESYIEVFSVKTIKTKFKKEENLSKTFFILKNWETGEQKEFITDDPNIIKIIKRQEAFQNEPIGTQINVLCTSIGEKIAYGNLRINLEELVKSLDGFQGWEFKQNKLTGDNGFSATIKINSTEETAIKKTILNLKYLLDCLALFYEIGFLIYYYNISTLTRIYPHQLMLVEEKMLPPIDKSILEKIVTDISTSETATIAQGINQSYCENRLSSRLMILWATFEKSFRKNPKPLLSKEEMESILKTASNIETLKSDRTRLEKLKEILKDPNRLPSKSRNHRLAESVSEKLGLDFDKVLEKIKDASNLRGKHVHTLVEEERDKFIEAESFLRDILMQLLKKKIEYM